MQYWPLWVILGLVALVLIPYTIATMSVAVKQFKKQLVRKNKDTWTRSCSWMENPEQVEMFRRGELWAAEFDRYKQDVDIVNDGLHLYGEYFDLGRSKKAVIIIPGRMEGCHYSHYFAKPYSDTGYNILVIDNRAHGLSEGKYNCLGLKEYRDVIAWGKMLHEKFGVEEVFLHGICIGSATCIQTLTAPEVPSYFTGMVADGMYKTFAESFKNHIYEHHPTATPVLQEVMLLTRIFCGVDGTHDGPFYRIGRLDRPILMIHSKEDAYSKAEDAQRMYDMCRAPKRLEWYEHGVHSHLRIRDEVQYDNAVRGFLADLDAMRALPAAKG